MSGWPSLPHRAPVWRLINARAPLSMLAGTGLAADAGGLSRIDLVVAEGRIASLLPTGTPTLEEDLPALDLDGGIVLPRLVDAHVHLDKGHIWPRAANPDGTFAGALASAGADREANWRTEDVSARMDFALRCAFAHGTGAMRTHLDSLGPQTAISWPVFEAMRRQWAGRIVLQAVALFPIDLTIADPQQFRAIADTAAAAGGVLGGVTYLGTPPDARLDAALDTLFAAAMERGLDLDLHVDESADLAARTLEKVADAAARHRFKGRIQAGHCCSAALMSEPELDRVAAKLRDAGIAIVSLPLCNLYLQDRAPGRTPRWRGVAPLTEFAERGVPVMVASDNTRDPFYAYGDLDMIEVAREAVRVLHLDHGGPDWASMIGPVPADRLGLDGHGRIAPGGPADFIMTRARSLTEFFARPQTDRVVLVAGVPIHATLPDYRELDTLFMAAPHGDTR